MGQINVEELYQVGDHVKVIQYKKDKPFKTYIGKVSSITLTKECGDSASRITNAVYHIVYDDGDGPRIVSDNKDPEKPSMQRLEDRAIT